MLLAFKMMILDVMLMVVGRIIDQDSIVLVLLAKCTQHGVLTGDNSGASTD